MKIKYCISFIGVLACFDLSAQYRIGVSYILSDITTKNINVFWQYQLNQKHHLGLGIKYHFNDDTIKPIFRFYYRNLYSTKIPNRFGITLDYKHYLFTNKLDINPYLFYNFQYLRSGAKAKNNLVDFSTGLVSNAPVTFDPINFFENHVGLGFDIPANDKLRVFVGMSGGVTFMTGINTLDDLNSNKATIGFLSSSRQYELSWLFNTGLTYSVGKEKKKAKKQIKSVK